MLKKTVVFIMSGLILLGGVFFYKHITSSLIIIYRPTQLFRTAFDGVDPKPDDVLCVLQKGDKGRVIGSAYSKERKFYKIKTDTMIYGYVLWPDEGKYKIVDKYGNPGESRWQTF